MRASAQYTFDYIRDVSNVVEYDKMAIDAFWLEQFAGAHAFQYNSYNSGFPIVSNRDFIMYGSEVWMKNGDFAIVTNSIEHPEVPVKEEFVRAQVVNSGLYIEECGSGDEECIVTYVVQLDPAGMIPSWVANVVAVNQPLVVAQIRNAIMARAEGGDDVHTPREPVPEGIILEPESKEEKAARARRVARVSSIAAEADAHSDSYGYSYSYDDDDDDDDDVVGRRMDDVDLSAPPTSDEIKVVRALEAKLNNTRARVANAEDAVEGLEKELEGLRARVDEAAGGGGCCVVS